MSSFDDFMAELVAESKDPLEAAIFTGMRQYFAGLEAPEDPYQPTPSPSPDTRRPE